MHITPLDIRKQPFRKQMLGFDRDEVNSFLEMVANEFEALLRISDENSTKIKVLQDRLERYEKIEKTLNDTLLAAQHAADDARLNAQKEAELIIQDAQMRAEKYCDQSRSNVHKLESDLLSLRTQRDSFIKRFQSMLRDQLALLQIVSDNLSDKKITQPVHVSNASLNMNIQPQPQRMNTVKQPKWQQPMRSEIEKTEFVEEDETLEEIPPEPIV